VRDEPITRAYRSLRADQERSLNAPPAWVDREKGLVSLPIDRAIALTVQDIRRGRTVVGAAKAEEAEEKPAEEGATPEDGAKAPEEGAQEAPATGEEGAPGAAPTDSDSKDAAPKGEQPGKAEPQKTEPEKAQPQKSEPSSPAPSPARIQSGTRGHSFATSRPSTNAPATLTTKVAHSIGTSTSAPSRSAVPTRPPAITANSDLIGSPPGRPQRSRRSL